VARMSDKAIAEAMKGLEYQLSDAVHMVHLTADMGDRFLDGLRKAQRAGAPAAVATTEDDIEQFCFVFNHAVALANDLKERFHAALEGKEQA
jgi:hypothetical protein